MSQFEFDTRKMTQDVEMKDTQAPSNSLSSTDPPTLKRMPQSPLAFSLVASCRILGFLFDFVGFDGIKIGALCRFEGDSVSN